MQSLAHSHPIAPQNFSNGIYCDVCRRPGGIFRGVCYSCPSCNIDICQGCYNQLRMINDNKHYHKLYLEKRNFICNVCRGRYPNSDSMYCSACDYDICMKCYISI